MTDHSRLSVRSLVSLAVLGVLVILAVVLYGRGGGSGNQASAECVGSAEISANIARVAIGGVAALQAEKNPRPLPEFPFLGPNGPMSPKDLRGKSYLFNAWATWCVPCREEMPALDALEGEKGGTNFTVLALNMDTRNVEKVPQWLKDNNVNRLTLYRDHETKGFQTLRREGLVTGLPTTILVDQKGCIVARMAGPAAWDGPDALNVIAALMGK